MTAAAPRADEGAERGPKSVLRHTSNPPETPDPYAEGWEAGMDQGHRDLLILNEDRRVKARAALAGIFDGDFNLADTIIGTLHRDGFEVVSADSVFMAPSISDRLPLPASSGDGGAPTPATRIEWPGEVVPGGLEAMSDDMGGVGRESFERQMRLVDQTILHDPAQPDRMGNCWQACVASVIGVPLEEVPHFVQMYESMAEVEEETRRWLQGRGYEMVEVGTTWLTDSRAVVILHGRSPRDVAHVVVGRGIEVVHDPHPSRAGLRSIQGGFLVMPVAAPAAPSPVPEEGPPTETPFDYLRRAVSLFLEGELEEEELGFALVESGLRSAATPEQGEGPGK